LGRVAQGPPALRGQAGAQGGEGLDDAAHAGVDPARRQVEVRVRQPDDEIVERRAKGPAGLALPSHRSLDSLDGFHELSTSTGHAWSRRRAKARTAWSTAWARVFHWSRRAPPSRGVALHRLRPGGWRPRSPAGPGRS